LDQSENDHHLKETHDGVRRVRDRSAKCDLCDYQGTKSHLKVHKQNVHENKKNWFCKACPYSTYYKADFQKHMRIHTGEKTYQCKICHDYFRHRSVDRHCKS